MSELQDYSGEFKPDLKLEDFSKDFLCKMMVQWSNGFERLYEVCALVLKTKVDRKIVDEWERETWVKVVEENHPRIAKALNMVPKNLLDVMKLIQILPDGVVTGIYPPEYEVINENHVIMKFSRCLTLEWYEKRNLPERIRPVCAADEACIPRAATIWFPNAEVKPLWLPPFDHSRTEEEKAKPPCAWEFKLKSR